MDWSLIDRVIASGKHHLQERFAMEMGGAYESPIEAMMAGSLSLLGMTKWLRGRVIGPNDWTEAKCRKSMEYAVEDKDYDWKIYAQTTIDDYRVDFFCLVYMSTSGTAQGVVIECDGHDFHERTKEQAIRDRSRDRALQARGYKVFRFTGAEIWRDPVRCAEEVWAVIEQMCADDMGGQA